MVVDVASAAELILAVVRSQFLIHLHVPVEDAVRAMSFAAHMPS